MVTLTKILCRLWQRATPSQGHDQAGAPNNAPSDDLTAVRGIGTATQDRLYRAGIRSFSQLAEAPPEKIQTSLGKTARGAKVESWIEQAADLAKAK